MDEIEFESSLAQFVQSTTSAMRFWLTANQHGGLTGNTIWLDENGEEQPGTEECQMRSTERNRGVHGRCWGSMEWK